MIDQSDLHPSNDAILSVCDGTRYAPVRFLGRGGAGQVWVVRHMAIRREFALKILHPHFGVTPAVADRLRLEAQATARIDHPAIVQVVDFWLSADGRACYVMELLRGRTLGEALRMDLRLPVTDVVDVGYRILTALHAAHRIGIVHRDVKPENIFFHELPGQGRVVKVLDFGLARVMTAFGERTPEPPMQPTRPGVSIGTPRFMSPEAGRGEPLDHRSDIYSTGLVLYEALTGCGPFDELSPGPVVRPSELVVGVPPELDCCVLRALEHEPVRRFQTAAEFADKLRSSMGARSNYSVRWGSRNEAPSRK